MPLKLINVAVSNMPGMPLTDAQKQQIQAVSPRIRLQDIGDLIDGERQGNADAGRKLDEVLAGIEVFFGAPPPRNIVSRSPKLRWIQSPLAGTDQFLTPDVVASPVILTKARIHDQQISETVFCGMLMLARHSLEHYRAQQQKQWVRVDPTILHSKTIGILGLGNIGQAVARIAKAFGMKVLATKAHPEGKYKNVDVVYPPGSLREILPQCDFLAIILPITAATKNLIGAAELKMMKPTAYIINVARGGIVDEEALAQALWEKWIAGAAFDVFASDPGPLPADSKLWDLPNIIITPHNAGHRADYAELVTAQFIRNLKRYVNRKPLQCVVDKKLGY